MNHQRSSGPGLPCRIQGKISTAALLFFGMVAALHGDENTKSDRPNVIVVLTDDLGYGDLGCYGHPRIQTPHIDRFAEQGMQLTHCYSAAPNCSPARTGLMTGRVPARVGVYNWIPVYSPMHVPATERTLATLLRESGYATCHVGKWHLNGDFNKSGQPQPDDHGFDHWFSTQNNALPNHRNPFNFVRNRINVGPLKGFAGHLVVDEACQWLSHHRPKDRPFFLYVCFHEPHEPIASARQYRDLYPPADTSLANHHGNVTQMDAAFGRLMDYLHGNGLDRSTLVVFTSDNGPAVTRLHPHGSTGGLREKKGHTYEGGIRVPGLLRWPGMIPAGSRSDIPVGGVDWLPTICEVAKVSPPDDRVLDGVSVTGLWNGHAIQRKRPLYWHFLRSSSAPQVAIRMGDWKLLAKTSAPVLRPSADLLDAEMDAWQQAGLKTFELYNLRDDPHETRDLSSDKPEDLARMKKMMSTMYAEVQAECPRWPAWKWPRYESGLIEHFVRTLEAGQP